MTKKENKIKPIEIHLDIYRCVIVVFCGHSLEEIKKIGLRKGISKDTLNRKFLRQTEETLEENIGGFCSPYGENNRDILVWVKKRPLIAHEYGVLYHELYHAVDMIFAGIDKNTLGYAKEGISEPRAYLYQHLVNRCNQVLWPAPKRKNK